VNDQLEYHDSPEDIPALQGDSSRPTPTDNWSPSLRLISAVIGGVLALYGAARRGLTGTALLVAGVGLAARGVANRELQTLVGRTADAIGSTKRSISTLLDQIYQFCQTQNLPRFMDHLKGLHSGLIALGCKARLVSMEWDAGPSRKYPTAHHGEPGRFKVKTSGKLISQILTAIACPSSLEPSTRWMIIIQLRL
jgi:hypothetical protein